MHKILVTESGHLSDLSGNLIEHLKSHAVRTDGPFTLRSGQVSSWYLDARQTTFDGVGAHLVGSAVLALLYDEVTAVGGMTMGADPISIATAVVASTHSRPLRAFSVRKEVKAHGVGGRLVGPVGAGDVVAAVDDTITTGGALIESIEVMLERGLVVAQAACVVDRSGGAAGELCAERGIPFTALARPVDLGVEER